MVLLHNAAEGASIDAEIFDIWATSSKALAGNPQSQLATPNNRPHRILIQKFIGIRSLSGDGQQSRSRLWSKLAKLRCALTLALYPLLRCGIGLTCLDRRLMDGAIRNEKALL